MNNEFAAKYGVSLEIEFNRVDTFYCELQTQYNSFLGKSNSPVYHTTAPYVDTTHTAPEHVHR